jgi:hypothetical protein
VDPKLVFDHLTSLLFCQLKQSHLPHKAGFRSPYCGFASFQQCQADVSGIHMLNQRNGAGSNLTADVARNGIATGLKNSSR